MLKKAHRLLYYVRIIVVFPFWLKEQFSVGMNRRCFDADNNG